MEFLKWCRHESERTIAILAVVAGAVAFLLGWLGVRDKALVVEQIPYVVSGALFGLLLIVIGTTVWLSADLRDEWIKLDRFEGTVSRAAAALEAANPRAARAAEAAASATNGSAGADVRDLVESGASSGRGHRGGASVREAGE